MPGLRRSSLFLALLVGSFGLATMAQGAELVIVSGGGSGNGVGMSQWGAEGYAAHGWDYRQILAHYYPHTSFAQASDVPIRVLLVYGRPSVAVSSAAPFLLVDSRGVRVHVPGGTVRIGTHPRVGRIELRLPLTADAGAQPLAVDGTAYRGELTLDRGKSGLVVVNTVPLERYVRSVVPSELPKGWQTQAYRAQAVAARSYAIAGMRPDRPFDLYADARSQVYGGIASETPATNTATEETAGETLAYEGRVIAALYDSSSGGRTAAVQDAFPGTSPEPYLVSVADPFDSISPYHQWQLVLTGDQLRARLGFAADSISVEHDPSGLASAVLLRSSGERRSVTGQSFASALGLRSARFSLALVSLEPPLRVAGGKVQLSGTAQGIQGAVIQRQTPAGGWAQVARIRPSADGRYSALVRRLPRSVYRVAVDGVAGPPVSASGG
jgi:stage II sporulation protein D